MSGRITVPVLPLNTVIGKYRIEKLVGAGGMGEVYRATNLQTRKTVAVKALSNIEGSSTALARFRNEAVIQYNLRHPNVAQLYEYFEYKSHPCIVMEFVEGRLLADLIRETGGLGIRESLQILADVCDAVSYMHSKGIIHRDIKSENIRLTAQGTVKLLDFGISVAKDTPALTRMGYTVGTPEKMAPEQHMGLKGDARSDVWAIGVLLYEMLTGSPPFASRSDTALSQDVIAGRYVAATKRRAYIPKSVNRLISTCLRTKPDERFASGGELLREVQLLRRAFRDTWSGRFAMNGGWRGWLRRRWALVLVGAVTLVAAVLVFYALSPGSAEHTSPHQATANKTEPAASPAPAAPIVPAAPKSNPASVAEADAKVPVPNKRAADSVSRPDIVCVPVSSDSRLVAMGRDLGTGTIRIETMEGPGVTVWFRGSRIGETPCALTGQLNSRYELLLTHPGYKDREAPVEIGGVKLVYSFGMEKD